MAVVLFDTDARVRWYPFAFTKAIADLRFGIFTIRERWQRLLEDDVYIQTADYLQCLYPPLPDGIHTWINAAVLPSPAFIAQVKNMRQGDALEDEKGIVACKASGRKINEILNEAIMNFAVISNTQWLQYPHQALQVNADFIASDFAMATNGKTSLPLSSTNQCLQKENIFIEEGATVEFAIINASGGPVYIGKNALIMEGSLLRGPIAILDNAVIKMGSKIYGATTIGLFCTIGGEVLNSIIDSFSNKGHDGFLGSSVVGQWCNIGAGSSNSNMKNTAGDVYLRLDDDSLVNAGSKFGFIMGDYSRIAINSSINTGSVFGVSCNIFGKGLLPKKIKNFSWGLDGEKYNLLNAINHLGRWKKNKKQLLSRQEIDILLIISEIS